jgi:hypothetical protein
VSVSYFQRFRFGNVSAADFITRWDQAAIYTSFGLDLNYACLGF